MVKLSKLGEELLIGEPSEDVLTYLNENFDKNSQEQLINLYNNSFEFQDVDLADIEMVENNTTLKMFSDSIFSDVRLNFKNNSKEYFYKLIFFNAGSILNFNKE